MNFTFENILIAFLLTLFAGLATGIGSCLAFFTKHTNRRFLSFSLGLSAGVMIYVSFMEIYPESIHILSQDFSEQNAKWIALFTLFFGMFLVALIDKLVPEFENPHTAHKIEELSQEQQPIKSERNLFRMGIMSAIAIAIHNFPEGIATLASALHDPALGITIAVSVAIHNIPEGIAVSVPIYQSTGSRNKAFLFSFLSGLAEPFGALVALLFLSFFASTLFLGLIFAAVAGIMIFISLDELLPAAEEYGEHHICLYGTLVGMAIMAVSLIIL